MKLGKLSVLLSLCFMAAPCFGQAWQSHITTNAGAPSGPCAPSEVYADTLGGGFYVCPAGGAWATPVLVGTAITLPPTQLPSFVGDTGSGGTKGAVPNPASGDAAAGKFLKADGTWAVPAGGGGTTFPSGAIILILSGTCPTGFTEVTALSGKFLLGTVAANSNVGTTGGNATITPSGTNSTVSFTPAGTNSTTSFTPAGTNGTTTTGATSAGTPAGTNGTTTTGGTAITATATTAIVVSTGSGNNVSNNTHTHPSHTHTVPAETFTGSAMATHTHTVPAETFTGTSGTVPAQTFTGTSGSVPAATFTGNAVDPSPPFARVIFCSKN